MESFLFIAFFLLVFIGLPVGIALLLYFIPKSLGYPRTGKYLTIAFSILVLVFVMLFVFEDQLFTKNDARELIEEQGFSLTDDFKLTENKSMTAIGDYYHTFTLEISSKDKQEAIRNIKGSANYKTTGETIIDFRTASINPYKGAKQIQNYETENMFVREYFKPSGKEGYAPTFRRISIDKKTNELVFEDIDE